MLDRFSDKEFIVLAGNHDYYTPLEEFSYYNFYELVFGEEFIKCHPNLRIVNIEPWMDMDGSLYLPWYWTENTDHFDEILVTRAGGVISSHCGPGTLGVLYIL